MKKIVSHALSLLLLITACGMDSSVVQMEGSTSMERVMGAVTEGYREMERTVTVNLSGTGSGAGIQAVLSGTCDIGLSSRDLTDSEVGLGAVGHLVALDGIAVIVHPENPIRDLTAAKLAAVFTGDITRWSALGGADAPIAVYGREAGSGTRTAFEEALGISGRCIHTNEYNSAGDITLGISSNPWGIGYVSLSHVSAAVKALTIGGTACSPEAVRDGSYPIRRPFLLVTGPAPLSPAARSFLAFALSEKAAGYIALAGAAAP